MPRSRLSPTNITTIVIAIIGTVGTVATAYFAFRSNTAPIELSINATQTAQAKSAETPLNDLITFTSTPNIQYPTQTETVFQTPSPTLTPVIEPTSSILFSESFDSNSNGWVVGVREGGITKQNRSIIDGVLQLDFQFLEAGYGWANVPDFRVDNFYLSVDTTTVQYSKGSVIGVVITFRIINQGNTTYAIEFNNDSTIALYLNNSIKNEKWQLLHRESTNAFDLREGQKNNFAVRVLGQRFTAYANGIEIYSFEDNNLRGVGEVGLGINGESGNSAIIRFDNIVITK